MAPDLTDLRLLKLARLYEAAYERFVLETALDVVTDTAVRRSLQRLVPAGRDHQTRIAEAIERVQDAHGEFDRAALARAALLDLVDVEAAACDFYRQSAARARDPELIRLFEQLADEEATHIELAQESLELADERGLSEVVDDRVERIARIVRDLEPSIFEGVPDMARQDLGRGPRKGRA